MRGLQSWKADILSWQHTSPQRPKRLICVTDDEKEHDVIQEAAGEMAPVSRASDEWEIAPEVCQIITGDATTLLSGALNRGYGQPPDMWPIRFGLLNNDVTWCGQDDPIRTVLADLRKKFGAYGATDGCKLHSGRDVSIDCLFDTDGGSQADVEEIIGEFPRAVQIRKKREETGKTLWVPLADHLSAIVRTVGTVCDGARHGFGPVLMTAGRYHDWAKAHKAFKDAFLADLDPDERMKRSSMAWAKRRPRIRMRSGFFHDLVGGCAMIASGMQHLPSYLVLSHHGRFRTRIPDVSDTIPATDLGDGFHTADIHFDIDSKTHRSIFLGLYRDHGPFILSYLEALLRVADMRTSRIETGEGGFRNGVGE